jgi:hypothetical protein
MKIKIGHYTPFWGVDWLYFKFPWFFWYIKYNNLGTEKRGISIRLFGWTIWVWD